MISVGGGLDLLDDVGMLGDHAAAVGDVVLQGDHPGRTFGETERHDRFSGAAENLRR